MVAAVGTNVEEFQRRLRDHLKSYCYGLNVIRVSTYFRYLDLARFGVKLKFKPEVQRLNSHMDAGNELRKRTQRRAILALCAATEISSRRKHGVPMERTAHLLRSLKRPEEVYELRSIYGSGFYLLGLYSPRDERVDYLRSIKGVSSRDAIALVERDEHEKGRHGQKTRDTFHLADVFIRLGGDLDSQIQRFLDLIYGCPYVTPTPDEHAMFLACAASLRSGSLARQVGAVVASERGDIISTGCNDVPRYGGGLYWPGPEDQRDHVKGYDSNDRIRSEILMDIVQRVAREHRLWDGMEVQPPKRAVLARLLERSKLFDITEYGREVHAELDALLGCARSGVSPRSGILYTTTFPCHNCAKHIVAAGIEKVIYIEPYPKSRAAQLYPDSVAIEERAGRDKVEFAPFVGVGPRRYFNLFSLRLGEGRPVQRKRHGIKIPWKRPQAEPRVQMLPNSYIDREKLAAVETARTIKRMG